MNHRGFNRKSKEVDKGVFVTWEQAEDIMAGDDSKVVVALTDPDEGDQFSFRERLFNAKENFFIPKVELRHKRRSLLKVPAPLALGAVLISLKKPKLLLLAMTGILLSGADVTLECRNRDFSLHDAVFTKSRKAAKNIHQMRDRMDDRFHDIGDQSFHRDSKSKGDRYFTIKL
jgi:hypothetical protein